MGVWLINNHIEIADRSISSGVLRFYGYQDIDEAFIDEIVNNSKISFIQISRSLPEEAYALIDSILEKREDLTFRIYGIYGSNQFDLSFLENMKHLKHLRFECHLRDCPDSINFNVLTKLNLKSLSLDAFDLRNYTFIQNLSEDIEKLTIHADTMGGNIRFDCRWLLRYKNLRSLWLGKKARKNIDCLYHIATLRSLSLRGIKLSNFDFLKKMNLEVLELLWNSNNDLDELKHLKSLKEIGLWRINKLENIDFISELENIEVIKLQDLKHIKKLPDLSRLKKLRRLVLDNTGIVIDDLDEAVKDKVERYWR